MTRGEAMGTELSNSVRKRVPESARAEYDGICARALEAFAGHGPVRMDVMLGFVSSFWVLLQYDRGRIGLSRWARGYLYHLSTRCGKRLSPEELEAAEGFLASLAGAGEGE